VIGYTLYSAFNASVRAANLKSIPFVAPTPDDIAANNITLSDIAKVTEQRTADNRATGQGYFTEQMFKVRIFFFAAILLYSIKLAQHYWPCSL
jgi:hypothetical protein